MDCARVVLYNYCTQENGRSCQTQHSRAPRAAPFGTLVTQGRRCGKQGCQCREGELHGPYLYVALRKPRGKGRLLYVPAELAEGVRRRMAVTTRVEAALEEISAINLELLSRRKLD